MKISVVMPILNEIRFVRAWYECVKKFADEIIISDMTSDDGTFEYFTEISKKDKKIQLFQWVYELGPYNWLENKIRNCLIDTCSGDWIIPLDADELVGDDFIESLNYLDGALIHRYLQVAPWKIENGKHYLRKRKLWPICKKFEGRIRWLRNWRGQFRCYTPRVFKRDNRIRYSKTGNHCMIQFKNYRQFSYHIPGVCKTHKDIAFYHLHYLYKNSNSRDKEIPEKLIEYRSDFLEKMNLL